MDYEIVSISSFNGKGGKVSAVEVFSTITGVAIALVRRAPYETKEAWVARAFAQAEAA